MVPTPIRAVATETGTRLLPIQTIRASMLAPLVDKLDRGRGLTDILLSEHDLLRSTLGDPYAAIPLRHYITMLEHAAVALGDFWLGLHLGQNMRFSDLGPLGPYLAAASTARSAFERMSRFLHVLQSHTLVRLDVSGKTTIWTYQVEDPTIWPRVQDSELTLAGTCQVVRFFLGQHWSPSEVHFEHGAPDDCSAHQRFFRAPVLFSQPTNRLFFSTADVDRPVRNEDPDLSRVLERHIADLLAKQETEADILRQVQRLIVLNMGRNRITVDRLAGDLGISTRTLQRELSKQNTSLRLLLRAHRQTLAESRFAAGRCRSADIAQTLGYADATAFWRAFKSWTGATPRDFQNQRKRYSPPQ